MSRDSEHSRAGKFARRTFLVGAGILGGGLVVGFGAIFARLHRIEGYKLPAGEGEASLGAWLKFARDGTVEVAVPHQEMGQGIYALAVLLAAEGLRLPVEAVRAVQAPVVPHFANPTMVVDGLPFDEHAGGNGQVIAAWTVDKIVRALGISATGGSTSTRHIAEPIRACAASALDMLMRAAAEKFGVAADTLRIAEGRISAANGKSASYIELADAAAQLVPRTIALPPLARATYVGKGIARADVPPKTNGTASFGIDARQPGQLYAAILHSPRLGGVLRRATLPKTLPGVRGLVEGSDYVAVVATGYATAAAALEMSEIVWDDSKALNVSTKDVFAAYRSALDQGAAFQPRWVIDSAGDVGAAKGRKIAATYEAPFLAHASMEPINATALVTSSGVRIWAGHQSGYLAKLLVARVAGLVSEAVAIETPYLGGGFGRRADLSYIVKAVEIASKFKDTPVQTIWSRAEDMRDDFYRPAAMADVSATLDSAGLPTGLIYRIAVPAVTDRFVSRILPAAKGGLLADRSTVDGAVFPFYGLPHRRIENFAIDLGIPIGFWRSVGFSLNNFFFETFIDELAAAAGVRPIDYRMRLLAAANGTEASRRASALLTQLARFDAANPLGNSLPGSRTGRGVALSECFHSFVGQLADVEVLGKEIRLKRVFAVVDCGTAIDPPNVIAQIRGGIVYGLSAALFGKVEIENGRIKPENFDTYPVLTLADAPDITVEIADSGAALGGVGEIGTPGIAPAVGNAIFAATGRRLRSLPFSLSYGFENGRS
jgi:isoquinoline 1-oxidoreductase beta subunit